MFTEKMTRLTSEFTSRILEALRAASLAELTSRTKAERPRAPRKARNKRPVAMPQEPHVDVTKAALAYFVDRGPRGATAHQLSAHLTELGLPSSADIIRALTEQGSIRDAGFRRSAGGGGNKTAPVYVSAA